MNPPISSSGHIYYNKMSTIEIDSLYKSNKGLPTLVGDNFTREISTVVK